MITRYPSQVKTKTAVMQFCITAHSWSMPQLEYAQARIRQAQIGKPTYVGSTWACPSSARVVLRGQDLGQVKKTAVMQCPQQATKPHHIL